MTTDTPSHDLRSALELCPFCGGEPRLYSISLPMMADCDDIQVACTECDTMGPSILFDQTEHGETDIPELEADAIAAWNRRTLASDTIGNGGGEAVAPFAYMLQKADGSIFWDEDHCIWTHKEDAEEAAEEHGMTMFGVFAHPPAAEPVGLREFEWPSEEEFAAQTDRERIACLKRYYEHRRTATQVANFGNCVSCGIDLGGIAGEGGDGGYCAECQCFVAPHYATPARTDDEAREADWRKRMVRLDACPVGLFWSGGVLCVKTEYRTEKGAIEAYIVSSGEFFWGERPQTVESQGDSMVVPVDIEFAERVLDATADEIAARTDDAAQAGGDDLVERVAVALFHAANPGGPADGLKRATYPDAWREKARSVLLSQEVEPAAEGGGKAGPIQIIGGPCNHQWAAMTMTGHMSCTNCRQTRPMTALEAAQWTK